jgi:hypothetical protein
LHDVVVEKETAGRLYRGCRSRYRIQQRAPTPHPSASPVLSPPLPHHTQRVVLVMLGTLERNYGCNTKAVKFVASSIISVLKATKALQ